MKEEGVRGQTWNGWLYMSQSSQNLTTTWLGSNLPLPAFLIAKWKDLTIDGCCHYLDMVVRIWQHVSVATQSIHRNPRETPKCCYCSFSPPSLPTTLPFQLPIEMERRTAAGTSGWQSELESLLIESKLPTVFLPAASSKLLRVPLGMLQGCQVGWQLSLYEDNENIKFSPAQNYQQECQIQCPKWPKCFKKYSS